MTPEQTHEISQRLTLAGLWRKAKRERQHRETLRAASVQAHARLAALHSQQMR